MNSVQLTVVLIMMLSGVQSDAAQGVCSVEHCTDPTRCTVSRHRTGCKCTRGYYGDWCDKDAHPKVMCGKDYITVRVAEDFFKYYKVPLHSLHHLPKNASCEVQREVIGGQSFFISRISKAKYLMCGGKPLEKNITHMSYSLRLQSAPHAVGNIIRDPLVRIEYTCIYPYMRTVSLPYNVIPYSSETVMKVDELDATVQIMLYTNATFTEAYTKAPTIQLRDKVYVEVRITTPEDYFVLLVDECWATQSPQPNATEGSAHTLLRNGCADDETVTLLHRNGSSGGQTGGNGESSVVRYTFDMFRFVTLPHDLYLHCTVQLCEPDDGARCSPNCKSITKREAVRVDHAHAHGLLSYGPIRIEMPDQPQSSMLRMVVMPVVGIWTVGFILLFLIAVAKSGSRRLAVADR